MLDAQILEQVKGIFQALEHQFTFVVSGFTHEKAEEMQTFLNDFASTSPNLSVKLTNENHSNLSFKILKDGEETGITFRGIPNGHEFTTLLLAVLNADGKGKNLPDETIQKRILALKGDIKLQTYVSLTCTNCPDVVQALNQMALYNPRIESELIDGSMFESEVTSLNIQAVPTVLANGEVLHIGRGDLGELLSKLEDKVGTQDDMAIEPIERAFDVVVVGGGPAGVAAAIYSARKGLKVAVVAGRIGGQVKDTVDIANLVSVPQTTGSQLAADLQRHMSDYSIELFENRKVEQVNFTEKQKKIYAKGSETFVAPAVILATGASWRKLGVPEESKYMGHGVHFCPHCDGPFYQNKHVAVVGGGNSGIEAAIDLAGIARKVTVLEFADTLRADNVLQEKARSLSNIEIFTMAQTTQVIGDGKKVTAIKVKDRNTDKEREIPLDGIFVQIGLAANSDAFKDALPLNRAKEIEVDAHCRTAIQGVYAAGDVTNVPYKQIIIAMGEGAKAALAAFDDRIRGVI